MRGIDGGDCLPKHAHLDDTITKTTRNIFAATAHFEIRFDLIETSSGERRQVENVKVRLKMPVSR